MFSRLYGGIRVGFGLWALGLGLGDGWCGKSFFFSCFNNLFKRDGCRQRVCERQMGFYGMMDGFFFFCSQAGLFKIFLLSGWVIGGWLYVRGRKDEVAF